MPRLLSLLLFLSSAVASEAHIGGENSTEVRVFSDGMRVVVRTSIPFAWGLMAERAPAMADEAGQTIARPLLAGIAGALVDVTAGGETMAATSTDCVFEVGEDVAFVIHFQRPERWPVVVRLRLFERAGSLDTGTIAAYDYTASRFLRDPEPIAARHVDQASPALSFSLEPAASAESVAPEPAVAPPAPGGRTLPALLMVAGVAAVVFLARCRLRAGV